MRGFQAACALFCAGLAAAAAEEAGQGAGHSKQEIEQIVVLRRWEALAQANGGSLILLSGSFPYRDVLMNAAWQLEAALGIYNIGIICFDEELFEWMRKRGKTCYPLGGKPRLQVISDLLHRGVDVTNNDVDAFWRVDNRNVLGIADIVAQRDRYPEPLWKAWGSTLCTGVLRLRATPGVIRLVEDTLSGNDFVNSFRDQLHFNAQLDARGLVWDAPLTYSSSGEAGSRHSVDFGYVKRGNASVALLPQDPYRRECTDKFWLMRGAKIVHCNADKTGTGKVAMLERYDAWVLPPDWEDLLLHDAVSPIFDPQRPSVADAPNALQRRFTRWCRELMDLTDTAPTQQTLSTSSGHRHLDRLQEMWDAWQCPKRLSAGRP